MDNKYYTDERNVQILISLLKAHGVRYVVVSPGTTHMCFVGSIQHDSYFKIFSCVDERSAAYMACGLSEESGEPVVIACTGATASRNYYSALTEAYYRKLPIIAVTAHQGTDRIGHLLEQNIDRRRVPLDVVKMSVEAVYVNNERDEHYCEIEINKALLECKRHGGGPVHINFFTKYSKNFTIKSLPPAKYIRRYTAFETLPVIPEGRIAVFVGSHKRFSEKETEAIDSFCATYDSVVFCDHTSGYYGKYKVLFSLPLSQKYCNLQQSQVDLIIHIGEVSGDTNTTRKFQSREVWRVNEDGEIRDMWRKLTSVFEMPEDFFFNYYADKNIKSARKEFYNECQRILEEYVNKDLALPLSNVWVAQQMSSFLPKGCCFHTGIWSCLRSMNFYGVEDGVTGNCNVGGFGIDGNLSSLIGASLYNPDRLYFGFVGDLAFFYDINSLGNRHIGNNLRILIINNGRGNEMRYSFSPASSIGEDGNLFLAASGHYGNLSRNLVKHYVGDLGFEYFSAETKDDFLSKSKYFFSNNVYEKPIVFEVFINDYLDEDRAYQQLVTSKVDGKVMVEKKVRSVVKSFVGENCAKSLKSVLSNSKK